MHSSEIRLAKGASGTPTRARTLGQKIKFIYGKKRHPEHFQRTFSEGGLINAALEGYRAQFHQASSFQSTALIMPDCDGHVGHYLSLLMSVGATDTSDQIHSARMYQQFITVSVGSLKA